VRDCGRIGLSAKLLDDAVFIGEKGCELPDDQWLDLGCGDAERT
jgi:hypothetical protein